jgi:hypothetical protein
MKIALVSDSLRSGCHIYRGLPYKKLVGATITEYDLSNFLFSNCLLDNDLFVVFRPHLPAHLAVIQMAHAMGKRIIIDWDDDFTQVPDWNPNYKVFKKSAENVKACSREANLVTVSTEALAERALAWGAKKVAVIKNAVDDCYKAFPKLERQPIVVWRGSKTHAGDVEVGKAKFFELAQTHKFVFFGRPPAWARNMNHEHVPETHYVTYMALLHRCAPEFMFVPLADVPFNHAKSDIAAQECYAVGAKLIHNGVGEYSGLPDWQEPRWLSTVNEQRVLAIQEAMK